MDLEEVAHGREKSPRLMLEVLGVAPFLRHCSESFLTRVFCNTWSSRTTRLDRRRVISRCIDGDKVSVVTPDLNPNADLISPAIFIGSGGRKSARTCILKDYTYLHMHVYIYRHIGAF